MARLSTNGNLDQQINAIAQKIKQRMDALQQEIGDKQRELDHLAGKYRQLTGRSVGGGGARVGRAGRGGKRIRRLGVDVGWINGQLSKQPMTLKQLQDVALREGRSALSVMNVLRANKNKFKSSEGSKDPSQRGRAAQKWSAK
jgi:hypothetical protein